MPVSSSSFALEGAQADGSRWCREVHTVTGKPDVVFYYLVPAGFDPAPVMAERVAQVNAQLADSEAEDNFGRDGALTTGEMPAAQFAARLRERYRTSNAADTCKLAWWLLRRISAGHITDAQCRSAFGLTTTQWTTFKTNTLTPQSNAWASVIAAAGS